jgi:hypothetical protein
MLPQEVQDALAQHIDKNYELAESGWIFANQDEDTLTGDFLGRLRSDWLGVGNYNFRFYYDKVRGRGPGALEKLTGTDGIITIEFKVDQRIRYKSFVFQAKKRGNPIDPSQVKKMKKYFPDGNVVFEYSPFGYFVKGYNKGEDVRINKFLIDYFFKCISGTFDMYYDSKTNQFMNGNRPMDIVGVKHKMSIQINKLWD